LRITENLDFFRVARLHPFAQVRILKYFQVCLLIFYVFGANWIIAKSTQRTLTLVQIGNEAYLSELNLEKIHPDLSISYNSKNASGEIRYGRRIIIFKLDSEEFQMQSEMRELDASAVIDDNGLYFSKEFVEELITELRLPISYQFNKNNLKIRYTKEQSPNNALNFIIVDAGHGGKDTGALGYFDAAEKDITLRLSKQLAKQLSEDFPRIEIILTRKNDHFIKLEKRSEIANQKNRNKKFGLFISIHCNATLSPKIKGFEVYYLAQNSDNKMARQLMLRENLKYESSAYIRKLTSQLLNAQIQFESKVLARAVFRALANRLDAMIKPRKVKRADFAVLRGSLMPAILIETGYLTNKDDLKQLNNSEYETKFVRGISEGIKGFLSEMAKFEK